MMVLKIPGLKSSSAHPEHEILFRAKKGEQLSHNKTQRKHKCILLCEGSQSEKSIDYRIPTV